MKWFPVQPCFLLCTAPFDTVYSLVIALAFQQITRPSIPGSFYLTVTMHVRSTDNEQVAGDPAKIFSFTSKRPFSRSFFFSCEVFYPRMHANSQ
jgi:hypothetical protein